MNKIAFCLLNILTFLLFSRQAQAVCPVCTVAVGAGLGFSRLIGIDDSVTGIWIGGLILSSGLWAADFIQKRGWKIKYPQIISTIIMFLFVIPPLYWSKMAGIPGNTLFGIDKIIFGSTVGFLVFLTGVLVDKWLRTTNNGKVYVYYQKVILPVFFLSVASYIMYLVTI